MSKTRVFLFSIIYFMVFSGYMAYLMMRTLASAEPDALIWYLKTYSMDQLKFVVMAKIGNNPMAMVGLTVIVFSALLFGFLTELGVSFLKKITYYRNIGNHALQK